MEFEREGMVSIWLGRFENEQALFDFVDFVYNEDGDSFNAFANEANLGWFDHDFQEAHFHPAGIADPLRALAGHSFSSSFLHDAAAAVEQARLDGDNSIFLLYDCQYDPAVAQPDSGRRLRFVGSFPYDPNAPTAAEIDDGKQRI